MPDDASAALARLREEAAAIASGLVPSLDARQAFAAGALHSCTLKAFAAVDAALNYHRPVQLYGVTECFNGSPGCDHGPDYDGDVHFEGDDGLWRCRDKPTVVICPACLNEDAEGVIFPCDEYNAILAALTGETGDGR
jgi:hypothetical protein